MATTTAYLNGLLTTQFDYTKTFIWNGRFRTASYTNSTGGTVTLASGTVLGRIFATGLVVPMVSTATNGSQIPIGILRGSHVVLNGASATLTYCYSGDVDPAALTFSNGTDTFATVILFNSSVPAATTTQYGTIEDILVGKGINPVAGVENTIADN